MNVVNASGWLEYFADAENADFFTEAVEDIENELEYGPRNTKMGR